MALGSVGGYNESDNVVDTNTESFNEQKAQAFINARNKASDDYENQWNDVNDDADLSDEQKLAKYDELAKQYLSRVKGLNQKYNVNGLVDVLEKRVAINDVDAEIQDALDVLDDGDGGIIDTQAEYEEMEEELDDLWDAFDGLKNKTIELTRSDMRDMEGQIQENRRQVRDATRNRNSRRIELEENIALANTDEERNKYNMELRRHETSVMGKDYYHIDYNHDSDNREVAESGDDVSLSTVESSILNTDEQTSYKEIQQGIMQIADLNGDGDLLMGSRQNHRRDGVRGRVRRNNRENIEAGDEATEEMENSRRGNTIYEQQLYKQMEYAFASVGYDAKSRNDVAKNIAKLMVQFDDFPDGKVDGVDSNSIEDIFGSDNDDAFDDLIELMQDDAYKLHLHKASGIALSKGIDIADFFVDGSLDAYQDKETGKPTQLPEMVSRYTTQKTVEEILAQGNVPGVDEEGNPEIFRQNRRIQQAIAKHGVTEVATMMSKLANAMDGVGLGYYYAENGITRQASSIDNEGNVSSSSESRDIHSLTATKSFRIAQITKNIMVSGSVGANIRGESQDGQLSIDKNNLTGLLGLGVSGRHQQGLYGKNEFRRNAGIGAQSGVDTEGNAVVKLGLGVGVEESIQLNLKKLIEDGPDAEKLLAKSLEVGASVGANVFHRSSDQPGEFALLDIGADAHAGIDRNQMKGITQIKEIYQDVSTQVFDFDSSVFSPGNATEGNLKQALAENIATLTNSSTTNPFVKAMLQTPAWKEKFENDLAVIVDDLTEEGDFLLPKIDEKTGEPVIDEATGEVVMEPTKTNLLDMINEGHVQDPLEFGRNTVMLMQSAHVDDWYDARMKDLSGHVEFGGWDVGVREGIAIAGGVALVLASGPVGWAALGPIAAKKLLSVGLSFRRYNGIYQESMADITMDRNSRNNLRGTRRVYLPEEAETEGWDEVQKLQYKLDRISLQLNTHVPGIKLEYVDTDLNKGLVKVSYTPSDTDNRRYDMPQHLHQALNIKYNPDEVVMKYNGKNELLIGADDLGNSIDITGWVEHGQQTSAGFLYLGSPPDVLGTGEGDDEGRAELGETMNGDPQSLETVLTPKFRIEKEDFDNTLTEAKQAVLNNITDTDNQDKIKTVIDDYFGTAGNWNQDNIKIVNGSIQYKKPSDGSRETLEDSGYGTVPKLGVNIEYNAEDKVREITSIQEGTNATNGSFGMYFEVRGINEVSMTDLQLGEFEFTENVDLGVDANETFNEINKLIQPFQGTEPNDFVGYLSGFDRYTSTYKKFLGQSNSLDDENVTLNDYKEAAKTLIVLLNKTTATTRSAERNDLKTSIQSAINNNNHDALVYVCNRSKQIFAGNDLRGTAEYTKTHLRGDLYKNIPHPAGITMGNGDYDQLISAREALFRGWTDNNIGQVRQLNGCGLTAWYRSDTVNKNRGYSMTSMGDTYYEQRFMKRFGNAETGDEVEGAKQARLFYMKGLGKSPADQKMVGRMLLTKIKEMLGVDGITEDLKNMELIGRDNLQKLMNGEEVTLGGKKMKFHIDRCFYLLGECRNESVGWDLTAIESEGNNATGSGEDPLEMSDDGVNIASGSTVIKSDVGNTSDSFGVEASARFEDKETPPTTTPDPNDGAPQTQPDPNDSPPETNPNANN